MASLVEIPRRWSEHLSTGDRVLYCSNRFRGWSFQCFAFLSPWDRPQKVSFGKVLLRDKPGGLIGMLHVGFSKKKPWMGIRAVRGARHKRDFALCPEEEDEIALEWWAGYHWLRCKRHHLAGIRSRSKIFSYRGREELWHEHQPGCAAAIECDLTTREAIHRWISQSRKHSRYTLGPSRDGFIDAGAGT